MHDQSAEEVSRAPPASFCLPSRLSPWTRTSRNARSEAASSAEDGGARDEDVRQLVHVHLPQHLLRVRVDVDLVRVHLGAVGFNDAPETQLTMFSRFSGSISQNV